MAECQSCGEPLLWCVLLTLEGGSRHPLDAAELPAAAVGVIVSRIAGEGEHAGKRIGMVLTAERMQKRLGELLEKGGTFHRSHFETCPHAERHRGVSRDQLGLDV